VQERVAFTSFWCPLHYVVGVPATKSGVSVLVFQVHSV